MGEKQELITKMLEMQKMFMDYEEKNGIEMESRKGAAFFVVADGRINSTTLVGPNSFGQTLSGD
jgi:hypothetical protein